MKPESSVIYHMHSAVFSQKLQALCIISLQHLMQVNYVLE